MKYTFKQIVESLPAKKNSNSSLWVKMLIRKLSFPFTWLFINLGFSANMVSVVSILVAIGGCFLCLFTRRTAVLIGILLINFWLVLDCVDGNIARVKGHKTVFGEFVDDIGGYYIEALSYFALSVCAYHMGGILFPERSELIVLLGTLSSIINILARLIYKDYCHFAIHAEKTMQEQYTVDDRHSLYYIRNRVSKELGISGAFMPLTFFCFYTNSFDLFTVFYFLFNGFALLSTTVIYIYKGDKYDRDRINNH